MLHSNVAMGQHKQIVTILVESFTDIHTCTYIASVVHIFSPSSDLLTCLLSLFNLSLSPLSLSSLQSLPVPLSLSSLQSPPLPPLPIPSLSPPPSPLFVQSSDFRTTTVSVLDTPRCVFYNYTARSWSTYAVKTRYSRSQRVVTCLTHHLTSFAVVKEQQDYTVSDYTFVTMVTDCYHGNQIGLSFCCG